MLPQPGPCLPFPCRQLTALARLEPLCLSGTNFGEGVGLLARLPRLRSAAFTSCEWLPACLSRLTGLQRLCINDMAVTVDSQALLHLTQLTCLALMQVTDEAADIEEAALAAVLPRLPQLRALAWFVMGPVRPDGRSQELVPLPGGAWLGRLQHLEAEDWQLAASLPFATSLQRLGVDADLGFQHREQVVEELAGLLRCAAALPQLRDVSAHLHFWPLPTPPAASVEALAGSPARLHWLDTDLLNDSALERLFCREEGQYPRLYVSRIRA